MSFIFFWGIPRRKEMFEGGGKKGWYDNFSCKDQKIDWF